MSREDYYTDFMAYIRKRDKAVAAGFVKSCTTSCEELIKEAKVSGITMTVTNKPATTMDAKSSREWPVGNREWTVDLVKRGKMFYINTATYCLPLHVDLWNTEHWSECVDTVRYLIIMWSEL